jgi:hypothetical protein
MARSKKKKSPDWDAMFADYFERPLAARIRDNSQLGKKILAGDTSALQGVIKSEYMRSRKRANKRTGQEIGDPNRASVVVHAAKMQEAAERVAKALSPHEPRKWTESEVAFLKGNLGKSPIYIASELDRTRMSIYRKKYSLRKRGEL